MAGKRTGILLLAFGGADSPEAVEPFMQNLMGGRVPPPALVEKIKARYGLIGGRSPLPEITRAQAAALERVLQESGGQYKVEVGMRYWHPFVKEGVDNLLSDGVERIVALSMAPFYSEVSTGAYYEEFLKVIESLEGTPPEVKMTEPFYNIPFFVDAIAEKITEALTLYQDKEREKVQVIFSAHSLPVSYIQKGDPYVEQFEATVKSVVQKLSLTGWHIAYQSKGGGQGEWLGPMVEEVMDKLQRQGFSHVLIVPAGFVSDHIETLYDIDIAQKKHAESIGLHFHRTASLNTSPLFIRAMAETVLKAIK